MPDFQPFPKLHRLTRPVVITEKLDGTNAQVYIEQTAALNPAAEFPNCVAKVGDLLIYAGSRTRWITPGSDNYGFALWVRQNAEELARLGPGHHYGEWWGVGIQRGYELSERRFSLFNTFRWSDATTRPTCCHVVPVLHTGNQLITDECRAVLGRLRAGGSVAAPGYRNPEGIVIFHEHARISFKMTETDEAKGEQSEQAS